MEVIISFTHRPPPVSNEQQCRWTPGRSGSGGEDESLCPCQKSYPSRPA